MSYCRWSSDNWQSDVYCYHAIDGYKTHVAERRRVRPIPSISHWDDPDFWDSLRREREALDTTPLVDIGLPYDGKSYTDDTVGEFLGRLLMLREAGYHVPEHVIEAVQGEVEDEAQGRWAVYDGR